MRINKPVDCGAVVMVKVEDFEELKKENAELREKLALMLSINHYTHDGRRNAIIAQAKAVLKKLYVSED